ncbi:MAG: ferredoxin--NADP reductase [Frankiales bacterium]|nr:ferredoxin--NADP reductase [Frankiales bacterium]
MNEHAPRQLRVKEVVRETSDAHTLVFDGPCPDYRPGQFLTLRIPSEQSPTARCYSLSSAPQVDELLRVTVKRTPGGYGSNWVCDTVVAGTVLDVLPPAGHFTPRDLSADLLLCAAGSGITPVMSILKSALAQAGGHLVLLYANRDEASVIFAGQLAELAAQHPDRLVVLHWLESVQGLPSVAQLRELLRPYAGREAFLCGPAPFMAAVSTGLDQLAVPRSQVHLEKFVSLTGDPWQPIAEVVTTDEATSTVEVTLEGQQHQLPWPAERVLLDVLLDAGLDAPYSCRQGNCSACACQLVDGEVRLLENNVLEQQDLDEGWILACQSVPLTPIVTVSYT